MADELPRAPRLSTQPPAHARLVSARARRGSGDGGPPCALIVYCSRAPPCSCSTIMCIFLVPSLCLDSSRSWARAAVAFLARDRAVRCCHSQPTRRSLGRHRADCAPFTAHDRPPCVWPRRKVFSAEAVADRLCAVGTWTEAKARRWRRSIRPYNRTRCVRPPPPGAEGRGWWRVIGHNTRHGLPFRRLT